MTSVAETPAQQSTSPVIALKGVTKSFGPLRAVDRVDLDIAQGEFLSLLGPSGCGKTTILRMIGGFEEPDEGDILLGGSSVIGVPPHRRTVNTVFQAYALFPHMTVAQNVAYGLRQRKVPRGELATRVAEALQLVRMEEYADRPPRQLSGGQQQRVAIARAIVNKPDVLLLDEPLSALDRKLREQMQVELKLLQRQVGITFVFVTHDQGEALVMSDRIVVMREGEIEQIGSPQDVYEKPRTSFVAGFIGTQNFFDATFRSDGTVEGDGALFEPLEGATQGYYPGSHLSIAIRAEAVTVSAERPPAQVNKIGGKLAGTSFLGSEVQYVVITDEGREVFARMPVAAAEKIEPGSQVWCSWTPESVRVFAREVTS
jgi:spermidine/putrescine transport system ATP-binding protein